MKTFNLPDLGEGLAESEIVKWHISVGDMVKLDQVVLTVETAKATVDVPAPYSGRIVSRHGEEGDVINIGALLLEIDETGAEQTVSEQKQTADAATVVGNVSQHAHSVNVDDFWIGGEHNPSPDNLITALPSARLLAKKLGVDLDLVKGSGPDGLIVDTDIYNEAGKQRPGTEVLKGARRTMVSTMAESHHNVAAVTITEEAVLEGWKQDEDISIRLVQAIVHACQEEPAMNAWFDAETMTRCVHSTVNIGIAVDSRHGLYVPVLRHQRRGLRDGRSGPHREACSRKRQAQAEDDRHSVLGDGADLGRDIFSRMIHGGRISIAVGLVATLVSLSIGLTSFSETDSMGFSGTVSEGDISWLFVEACCPVVVTFEVSNGSSIDSAVT